MLFSADVTASALGLHESTDDQESAGRDESAELRGRAFEQRARQVGHDNVGARGHRAKVGFLESHAFARLVQRGVLHGIGEGIRIDVDADGRSRPKLDRRNREDARSTSDVEHGPIVQGPVL